MSVDEVMSDLHQPWQEHPKLATNLQPTCNKLATDCISRQAAIDAITEIDDGINMDIYTNEVRELLREVPSVQPDIARDIATILENEKDMRVISQNAGRNCKTCRYNGKEWDEEPCDSCTMGGENNHYKPEQRWIPVTERLPEKRRETYWVCTDTEAQCECRWTDNKFGLGSSEWGWSIFDYPQYSKVVAWMPLPEPWRGGQDGTT